MSEFNLPAVPKGDGRTELNSGNAASSVDKFSGQHTTSLIVAILFVVVLICLVSMICFKVSDAVVNTGMFSLLSALLGFFTGTKAKRD